MSATSDADTPVASAPAAAYRPSDPTLVAIGEVQLLLAEKRTSLAVMRTGIAVFALPLSAFSVLIATSRYYEAARVAHLLLLMFLINGALIALGSYLIFRAIGKIRIYDERIEAIKRRYHIMADVLD